MNTRLIRKAKKRGIPILLDNPIAHMRDYYEVLKPEYDALGMPFHDALVKKWVEKAEYEYANADWYNVDSNFVKKSLVKRGVQGDRVFVTPTCVDVKKWEYAASLRTYDRKKMTFVYTGLICPRKGIHYLVKAWIKANLYDAELFVCGSETIPWENVCSKIPDNITFLGRLTHDELVSLYAKTDIYVMPSLLEGLVRSGLEAMASGLALVVTEETGLADACDDGVEGWFVPSRNVDALAERLVWCREHPEEVRIAGQNAFKKMQGRDFASYGKQCAETAKKIISLYTPESTDS